MIRSLLSLACARHLLRSARRAATPAGRAAAGARRARRPEAGARHGPGAPPPRPPPARRAPPGAPARARRSRRATARRRRSRCPPRRAAARSASCSATSAAAGSRGSPSRCSCPRSPTATAACYVSGGFESVSFYALDADDRPDRLGDQRARGQRPDRGDLRRRPRHLQHRELHAVRARREDRQAAVVQVARRSDAGADRGRRRPRVRGASRGRRHRGSRRTASRPARPSGRARSTASCSPPPVVARRLGLCVDDRRLDVPASGVRPAASSGRAQLQATTAPWIADGELFVTPARARQGAADRRRAGDRQGPRASTSASRGAVPRGRAARPRQLEAGVGVRGLAAGRRARRALRRDGRRDPRDRRATGEALWHRRYAKAKGRALGRLRRGRRLAARRVDARRQLFGLDVDTGYTLWSYDLGHPVVAQPVDRERLGLRRDADGLRRRAPRRRSDARRLAHVRRQRAPQRSGDRRIQRSQVVKFT